MGKREFQLKGGVFKRLIFLPKKFFLCPRGKILKGGKNGELAEGARKTKGVFGYEPAVRPLGDILDALTKDFFARKGNAIEETAELAEVQGRPNEAGYEPVSSTLWRQREEYCARLIQNAWRKHKRNRGGATDQSDEGEVDVEGELEARQIAVQ
ncbi:hypothetical protein JTB14_035609 [Gonioctena quinquepunctata]|nr:hypothetical protein JTB14_035609 [Gonioctena quinquepunctata]